MIETVAYNEAFDGLKARAARKSNRTPARLSGDKIVADLARKTSWAWRLNANYMN
jgi:hypothetical protein